MFIQGRIFTFAFLALFLLAMAYVNNELKSGKRRVNLAKMPVFDALDEGVWRAAEMGRPVHYTFGAGAMDASVFASFKILGYVAAKCAQLDVRLIVSVALPEEQAIAEEILAGSWRDADKTEQYRRNSVRYLSSSFAYTTGVLSLIARERPAANFALGSFFNESLLIPVAGLRAGALQVGGTAVTIQAPFLVAVCDYSLLGEELLVAGAYLSDIPIEKSALAVQEIAKIIAVALSVTGCLLSLLGCDAITRILTL